MPPQTPDNQPTTPPVQPTGPADFRPQIEDQDVTIKPQLAQYGKYLGGSLFLIGIIATIVGLRIFGSITSQSDNNVPAPVLISCVIATLLLIAGLIWRVVAHSQFSVTTTGLRYTGVFVTKQLAFTDIRRIAYIKQFSSGGASQPYARIAVNRAGKKWGSFFFLNSAFYVPIDLGNILQIIEKRSGGTINRYNTMTPKQLAAVEPGTTFYVETHPVKFALLFLLAVIVCTIAVTALLQH